MDMDRRMVTASFRWNVIGPLVSGHWSEVEKRSYRRRVLKEKHMDPLRGPRSISASTLNRWIRACESRGISGLYSKERSDKGGLDSFSEAVLERAIELRREAPRRTVQRIVELLAAEFPEEAACIKRSTLDRHLRQRGWSRAALRKTAAPHVPFEMAYRNAMWTGDVLHGPNVRATDGGVVRAKIFGWVDDHSRLCVHLEAYENEQLPALERALQKAILKFGVPERLFLDNALTFSSTMMDLACATLGITKVHSTPGYAPSRGKIERLFRTVRDELLCEIELLPPVSLEELNRHLAAWADTHYNCRVHSRTGQAPLDRWELSEVPLRTVSPHELQQAFLLWARRKVGSTGEVKVFGNIYFADPTLAGQTVVVRYDPWDMASVWLWREGEAMRRITPTRLVTRRLERAPTKVEQRESAAARRYLENLTNEHQRQLAREMHLIRFVDLPDPNEEEE